MEEKRGLSANTLKYFAAAAMLIDHIAWCFVDTYSLLGQLMHTIGRLTAPIMCFFIAEGFYYTKNVKKYLLRLGIFAVISWFPYIFMDYGTLPFFVTGGRFMINYNQSMIFSLFLGLLALVTLHSENSPRSARVILAVILAMLSVIGDWPVFAVVWIVLFDAFRGSFKKQAAAFMISSVIMDLSFMLIMNMPLEQNLFQFGVLFAVVPLYFYNGKRGKGGKFGKWFFYIFYPLHMLILGIMQIFI